RGRFADDVEDDAARAGQLLGRRRSDAQGAVVERDVLDEPGPPLGVTAATRARTVDAQAKAAADGDRDLEAVVGGEVGVVGHAVLLSCWQRSCLSKPSTTASCARS